MRSSQTRPGMSTLLIANTNHLRIIFNRRPLLSNAHATRTVLARRSFFEARVPPVAAFAAAKARVLDVEVCVVPALVVSKSFIACSTYNPCRFWTASAGTASVLIEAETEAGAASVLPEAETEASVGAMDA